MSRRGSYQLIGFGLALLAVGLLNLAVNAWGEREYRSRLASWEGSDEMANARRILREQEGITDAGTDGGPDPRD